MDNQKRRERISFVDNIRLLLAFLVVLLHAWSPYGLKEAADLWFIRDSIQNPLFDLLTTIYTSFFEAFAMSLFFFLAGYFTVPSYDRLLNYVCRYFRFKKVHR